MIKCVAETTRPLHGGCVSFIYCPHEFLHPGLPRISTERLRVLQLKTVWKPEKKNQKDIHISELLCNGCIRQTVLLVL